MKRSLFCLRAAGGACFRAGLAVATLQAADAPAGVQSTHLRFSFAHAHAILSRNQTGIATPVFAEPLPSSFSLHFTVVDTETRPAEVTFEGPAGSVVTNVLSAGFWDFLGPTTRRYYTSELTTPPSPPGGTYVVHYKSAAVPFTMANPEGQARQIRVKPSASLDAGGRFTQTTWEYQDMAGHPITIPSHFRHLTLRIESDTAQLFHQDNLPLEPRSQTMPGAISWATVRNITFTLYDDQDNMYLSPSRKWDGLVMPVPSVPDAVVGVPYTADLVVAGGQPPYTWSQGPGDPIPAWLNLSLQGRLQGSAPATASNYFTVRITDSRSQILDWTYLMAVVAPGTPDLALYWIRKERRLSRRGSSRRFRHSHRVRRRHDPELRPLVCAALHSRRIGQPRRKRPLGRPGQRPAFESDRIRPWVAAHDA